MKKTKTQKGITLVALIITIVVLLILAVVTISSVQEGGIIIHARDAKTEYEIAQEKEKITLVTNRAYLANNGVITKENLSTALSTQLANDLASIDDTAADFIQIKLKSGREYKVYLKGQIEEVVQDTPGGSSDNTIINGGSDNTIVNGGSDNTIVNGGETGGGEEPSQEEYGTIFTCEFNEGAKTATIVGFKEKNINTIYAEGTTIISEHRIIDNNGQEVATLTIPSEITKGNNTYAVTEVDIKIDAISAIYSGVLGVTSVTIPSSVLNIGSNAFYNFKALTTVNIASANTRIDKNAFANTAWKDSIKTANSGAFIYNNRLIDVNLSSGEFTVPSGIKYIQSGSIGYNNSMTITIPSSVEVIEDGAFVKKAPDIIPTTITLNIDQTEGSITGAPWGLTNSTINWK